MSPGARVYRLGFSLHACRGLLVDFFSFLRAHFAGAGDKYTEGWRVGERVSFSLPARLGVPGAPWCRSRGAGRCVLPRSVPLACASRWMGSSCARDGDSHVPEGSDDLGTPPAESFSPSSSISSGPGALCRCRGGGNNKRTVVLTMAFSLVYSYGSGPLGSSMAAAPPLALHASLCRRRRWLNLCGRRVK